MQAGRDGGASAGFPERYHEAKTGPSVHESREPAADRNRGRRLSEGQKAESSFHCFPFVLCRNGRKTAAGSPNLKKSNGSARHPAGKIQGVSRCLKTADFRL